jgi:hypothetical protein
MSLSCERQSRIELMEANLKWSKKFELRSERLNMSSIVKKRQINRSNKTYGNYDSAQTLTCR